MPLLETKTQTLSLPSLTKSVTRRRRANNNKNRDRGATVTVGSYLKSGYSIPYLPFFGYSVRKKLNYFTPSAIITSGASGAAGAYVFSANGLFDPDITGTGGQPMSFDQAMLYFNHYTVHTCEAKITFQSDSATLRATVGVFISGSTTVTTDVTNLIENGDGALQILQFAGTAGGTATFHAKVDAGKFQTVKQVLDDPNMRGDSASNPTEQMYFHLIAYNAGTAATVQVEAQVLLTYDVTFHEPRKGPSS